MIYYGTDESIVLNDALKTATEHMHSNSSFDMDSIQKFVLAGTYPNFFHLKKKDDENEISIEDSREIISFLSQKPSLSGNRAVLIENFENMSRSASNSILKVLEEPPLDAVLILTTTKLLSILPTIRSRCVKIRIKSESIDASEFPNPTEFACSLLKNIDRSFIEKSIEFIDSNCRNCIEFSKQNSDNFELFLNVSLAYCSFKSSKEGDLRYSKRLLSLQSFSNLAKNTYPDKQSGIIVVCEILKS